MAVLISWCIDAAARHIGDPNKQRVRPDQWLDIATLALTDICTKYNILKYEEECDLPADGLLTYPDQLVTLHEVWVSLTPTVESSFYKLDEKFRDEWNQVMLGGIPASESPQVYFADKDYIRIGSQMTADVTDGCRVSYYATPDPVMDPTTTNMPLPDHMRSYFVQRMVVYGLFADERDQLAREEDALWQEREDEMRRYVDHRSSDRRESLRPASGQRRYRGMA